MRGLCATASTNCRSALAQSVWPRGRAHSPANSASRAGRIVRRCGAASAWRHVGRARRRHVSCEVVPNGSSRPLERPRVAGPRLLPVMRASGSGCEERARVLASGHLGACPPVHRAVRVFASEPSRPLLRRRLLHPVAVQPPVGALGVEQLVVRALLDDPAAVEHDDPAGLADRRQAVGDDDRRAAREQPAQAGLDAALGVQVDVRRRLVEDEDPRVGDERAGERDELALAGRELRAALADLRVVAVLERLDERPPRRRRARRRGPRRRSRPGRPKAMFSPIVPLNRKPSCGTMPSWRRSDACVTSRRSWPSTSTAPSVGS